MEDKSLIQDITVGKLMQTLTHHKNGQFKANMNIARTKQNIIAKDWLRNYKQKTRHHYAASITELMDKTGLTLEDLRNMEAPKLKQTVKAFVGDLVDQSRLNTGKMLMKAAKSFSEHYEHPIEFSWSEKIRVGRMKNEYVPKPHEVYAIAEAAGSTSKPKNPRNRAMIMTDWVSALRENAIPSLRWGAVLGYSEGDCPIPLRVGNSFQKIGQNGLYCIDQKLSSYGVDYYYTFIAKEAFSEIQDWKQWLEKKNGEVEKMDYMFTNVCALWGDKSAAGNRPVNQGYIWRIYKNAVAALATIDSTATTFHKLRDSFKSVMIRAEVDEEVREVMMGHAPKGSAKNYFDYNDVEMARSIYSKADFSRQGQHRLAKVEQENALLTSTVMDLQKQVMKMQSKKSDNNIYETIAEMQREIMRMKGEKPLTS